ncbi:hypothetical protein [Streptomyces sp. CC224B]|uniref:hypothetical protein n=1 Tax=Streptomyces sp. CC224B TaxID=3044571 RepID=UPI0024A8BB65|nr:hypothetical protein [Streptomyces sp. CC224B]
MDRLHPAVAVQRIRPVDVDSHCRASGTNRPGSTVTATASSTAGRGAGTITAAGAATALTGRPRLARAVLDLAAADTDAGGALAQHTAQ